MITKLAPIAVLLSLAFAGAASADPVTASNDFATKFFAERPSN